MWEEHSKLQVTQSEVQWWLQTKSVRPFGKIMPVKLKITSFWKNCIRNTFFLLFHSRTHPPQNDASVTVDLLSRRGDESEKCLVNFPKSNVVIWILSVLDFVNFSRGFGKVSKYPVNLPNSNFVIWILPILDFVNFSSGLLCHWSNDDMPYKYDQVMFWIFSGGIVNVLSISRTLSSRS